MSVASALGYGVALLVQNLKEVCWDGPAMRFFHHSSPGTVGRRKARRISEGCHAEPALKPLQILSHVENLTLRALMHPTAAVHILGSAPAQGCLGG